MSEREYSREELLKIVVSNLKNTKERSKEDYNHTIRTAINNIKTAFIKAGLEKELDRIERKVSDIMNLTTHPGDTPLYYYLAGSEPENPDYEEMIGKISRLEYEFLVSINSNIPYDKDNDPEIMNELFDDYIAGFIYDPKTMSKTEINETVLDRIVEIYSFYGLILYRETMDKLLKMQEQEYINFRTKQTLGKDEESTYQPEFINEYIYDDIAKRIKPYTEEIESEKEMPETNVQNNGSSPINDKITRIKNMLSEYEELSSKEAECLKQLEEIRRKKATMEERISGIKI